MMECTRRWVPLVSLLLLGSAWPVGAQGSAVDLPRGDLGAGVGWFSGTADHPGGIRQTGDAWYHDAAWLGVQAGYYVTENVKLEAEASWSGTGNAWSGGELRDRAGRPYYSSTEHSVTTKNASAGLVYQFGHNLMLHPFVGAGVDVDFVSDRRVTTSYGDPLALVPPPVPERVDRTRAAAFALVGIKAYFTERAFFRADLKGGGAGSSRKVVPRIGFGIDF